MDKFFVNPGSATGAFFNGWEPDAESSTPSFCLMDVRFFTSHHCRFHRSPCSDADAIDKYRFKASPSHSTYISSARTSKATKTLPWKRSHIQSRLSRQAAHHSYNRKSRATSHHIPNAPAAPCVCVDKKGPLSPIYPTTKETRLEIMENGVLSAGDFLYPRL